MQNLLMISGILGFFGVMMFFNLVGYKNIQEENINKVAIKNVATLNSITPNNEKVLKSFEISVGQGVTIDNKYIHFKTKKVIYGGKIVNEIGYKTKKALYVNEDIKKVSYVFLNNNVDIDCKKGDTLDVKLAKQIFDNLKKHNLKVTDKIDDITSKVSLDNEELKTIKMLQNKKCSVLANKISKKDTKNYVFIPKDKMLLLIKDKKNQFTSELTDVINKQNGKVIGYLLNYHNYTTNFELGKGKDYSDKLNEICDAGFYFDNDEYKCKLNIERNLKLKTYFDNIQNGKIQLFSDKINTNININTNNIYYIRKTGVNNWIDYGLQLYDSDVNINYNANVNTGYTLSVWFNSTKDGEIFNSDNLYAKIDSGKLKIKLQGHNFDLGDIDKNTIHNLLISYDKIVNRVGIYLDGEALVKSVKNNGYSYNLDKNIDFPNKITLGKGNIYYQFKLWSEGFDDFVLDIIYNFELKPGEEYKNIQNPYFPETYKGLIACTKGLQTIKNNKDNNRDVGLVNCNEILGIAGEKGIVSEISFNKGIYSNDLQVDKGNNIFSLKDTQTRKLNINTLNYMLTNIKGKLDLRKMYNTDIKISLNGLNGFALGLVAEKLGDGVMLDGKTKIERDGSEIKINGVSFNYKTDKQNFISISSDNYLNKSYACVNTECKIIGNKIDNGDITFKSNGVIDNIFYTNYTLNFASLSTINEKLLKWNPNYNLIKSCNEVSSTGIYTIKNSGKTFNVYCYIDGNNKYELVYTSIFK